MKDFDEIISQLEKEASAETGPKDYRLKREQEIKLWSEFKRNPHQDTFMPLYNTMKPIIYKAALKNMRESQLPKSAHLAWAANSFLEAAKTYDPSKGGFTTHVYNAVENKGKRLNYKYQNVGYIPESRAAVYQPFLTAQHLLTEQLGRPPSAIELADELKIPVKRIEYLKKEVRKDFVADEKKSEGIAFHTSDRALKMFHDIQYNLIPHHQLVLEHAVGLNGTPAVPSKKGGQGVDLQELSRRTKLPVPKIRSAFKTITREVKKYRGTLSPDVAAGEVDDVDTDG